MSDCPADELLARLARGLAQPDEHSFLDEHLDGCEVCRRVLVAAISDDQSMRSRRVADRYELLHLAGAGAMGMVWAAHDTKLDRRVALKLLTHTKSSPTDEGRLMARVVHPNVVQVFDVGHSADGDFVAMEFVSGGTLRRWLESTKRTPADVVRVFAQAAAGLAAAHRSAVVHRDFKPENVLVDDLGQVKVTDFGLSTAGQARGQAGTPAYLSPEQDEGKPADARSDQFSFCIALFEALQGRRPFTGTMEELTAARRHRAPPLEGDVPAHLRTTVARGLSLDAAGRFASMDELLAALVQTRSSTSAAPRAVAGITLIGAVAIALFFGLQPQEQRAERAPPTPTSPSVDAGPSSPPPITRSDVLVEEEEAEVLPPTKSPIVLTPGEARSFKAPALKRAFIEAPEVVEVEGLEGTEVMLTGGQPGATTLTLELGASRRTWKVEVKPAEPTPATHVTLAVGERHEARVPGLLRLALGESAVVDLQSRSLGVLVFQALRPGTTNALLWTRGARRLEILFTVVDPQRPAVESLEAGVQKVIRLPAGTIDVTLSPQSRCGFQFLPNDELLLLPRAEGEVELTIQLRSGTREIRTLRVIRHPE